MSYYIIKGTTIKAMAKSHLEEKFIFLWEQKYPHIILDREVKLIPNRRFRFDFVHSDSKVAIEINGGNWGRGRHTRASALDSEYAKINLAQLEGWEVYLLSGDMLTDEWLGRVGERINHHLHD